MHLSTQAASAALTASPLSARHSTRGAAVAPSPTRRAPRAPPAGARASMGAFAASSPSDGGATVAWLAGQALAAAAVLGAYAAWESKAASQSRVDAEEACPVCMGSGLTPCACTRWSADGEGCATCRGSGRSPCHACKGGGHRRPLLARLPVQDRPPTPPL